MPKLVTKYYKDTNMIMLASMPPLRSRLTLKIKTISGYIKFESQKYSEIRKGLIITRDRPFAPLFVV